MNEKHQNGTLVFLVEQRQSVFLLRRLVKRRREEGKDSFAMKVFSTEELDREKESLDECCNQVRTARFVFLWLHGSTAYFRGFLAVESAARGVVRFFYSGIDGEVKEMIENCGLTEGEYQRIADYLTAGGEDNMEYMLDYLAFCLGQKREEPPEAVRLPESGIYSPSAWEKWRKQSQRSGTQTGALTVGILLHEASVTQEDTAQVDLLIRGIEEMGGLALPIYTRMEAGFSPGESTLERAMRQLWMEDGSTRVDVVLVTCGFSLSLLARTDGTSVFRELNVPVIQLPTMCLSREEWEESELGIDLMSQAICIYQPEMDGQLIGPVIASTQAVETEEGIQWKAVPLQEQVEAAVRLALNWGRLRNIPQEQKKIAILLHNMPPRRDMVGCAYGLDTPESLRRIVARLRREGIRTGWSEAEEKGLFRKAVTGLTNDNAMMSEDELCSRSAGTVNRERYDQWFAELPETLQNSMRRDWGDPPGQIMTARGQLLIPGIVRENVLIAVQPARSLPDRAEELCHSQEITCPHQYLAFYRWITEVFGAHAIIHLGTHGTLEWLPGKNCGLSEQCLPRQVQNGAVNIYPYSLDVVGEGMQARRRSAACIIDHLPPTSVEGELYEELRQLQETCDDCHQTLVKGGQISGELLENLWRQLTEEGIARELKIGWEVFEKDPKDGLARIHRWLDGIAHTKMKDGFHIFGEGAPEETESLIRALNGCFIPPGPGGCLSRRGEELLPTGRNFFAVDPTVVPDRAAWAAGQRMAEQLLDRYRTDEGCLPETLAIVVYSGDVMRTGGEDIAEILYLYGIRPVWQGNSRTVTGLEVIPGEELGRPRIDVILRISGLFRDTYPNLIERMEDAVNLAASLPESPERNFVKKHVLEDMKRWMDLGDSASLARAKASLRVFGCPPQNYGAGVDGLIHSGAWEDRSQLAEAYTAWSGHAYGRTARELREWEKEMFQQQLKRVQATVKNKASDDTDLLDDDDFYIYHGGLIRAISEAGGQAPRSYSVTADGTTERIESTQEEMNRVMRGRICSPRWKEAMMRHGFRGAQEMSGVMDMVFGWDATAQLAEDWMYDAIAERWVESPEIRAWMEEQNPWALQSICGRLLEAAQRRMWNVSEERRHRLTELYLYMEGMLEGETEHR